MKVVIIKKNIIDSENHRIYYATLCYLYDILRYGNPDENKPVWYLLFFISTTKRKDIRVQEKRKKHQWESKFLFLDYERHRWEFNLFIPIFYRYGSIHYEFNHVGGGGFYDSDTEIIDCVLECDFFKTYMKKWEKRNEETIMSME